MDNKVLLYSEMGNLCCPHSPDSGTIGRPASMIYEPKQKDIFHKTQQNQLPIDQQSIFTDLQHADTQPIEGNIDLPDGSRYVGYIKNGIPHGQGTQYHENGDKYMGNFVQGMKQGQGRYQYANGAMYMGEFQNGDITGKGRMQWSNGDWYQGGFKNNIINGYGKYYSKQNSSYYEGTYLQGKRHGKGKIVSQGTQLDGYWELGVFRYKKIVPYEPI